MGGNLITYIAIVALDVFGAKLVFKTGSEAPLIHPWLEMCRSLDICDASDSVSSMQ